MSNSIKQSKLLLEGWRKFLVKEAEQPIAESGGNVVRVFDFDGTLVTPKTQTKYSHLLGNLFYVPFLNSAKYDEVMNDLKEVAKNSANHNTEIENLMNPSRDYIVTAMSSIGVDKPITKYLLFQLAKNDPLFLDFARRVAGINVETSYATPASNAEDGPDIEPDILSEDAITQEEIQSLRQVISSDPEITSAKDAYRINTTPQVVRKIITKLGKGFDVGKKVSMKDLEDVKREIVSAAYPKMSNDHIKVSLNIAMLPEDPEQSGIVKGSSGKFKAAKEIADAHPSAKFEVYDNNVTSLSQVRMGLQGKTKDQAEMEATKESDEKFDEKTPLSVLENKIIIIKNSLAFSKKTDFKLVQGSKIFDYNNGPFSLGKKQPSSDPKMVGYGGGYRSLRKLASIYIRKRFLPTTESGKGRTSADIIQQFKKFRAYCDENGYKDLMDCITFQGDGYAMIYKFFEPATQGIQPTFELNKIVAEQLVKLYENAEPIASQFKVQAGKETQPVAAQSQQTRPATSPETEESEEDIRAADTEAMIRDWAMEDMDLDWNSMNEKQKEKYRAEYKKSKEKELRETILQELKPLLNQLNGVLSNKKLTKR